MIIYPKTNEYLGGLDALKPYIDKGIEIQFLKFDNWEESIEETLKRAKEEIPTLQEIIIHPPIRSDFNFEALAFSNLEREKKIVNNLIELSEELHIKIQLLYHTFWTCLCWKNSGVVEKMEELLSCIENTKVSLLIENMYPMVEHQETEKCSVLDIAKTIDNEHLKVCLDICHMHCLANIFKLNFDDFLEKYLDKEEAQKYIFQIHFAGTLKNDGFIDHKTHGRVHDSVESFEKDYEVLRKCGIENKVIVPEVSEENYETRADQIEEIKMLLKIHQ